MIGPYDLSGSLGIPGQLAHSRVVDACAAVGDACRRAGKAFGTQLVDPTADDIARTLSEGYTFVVLGSDLFVLWKWSERMRAALAAVRQSAEA
jgi:2-dehydro-3-deoxyglucarate aldolase